MDKIHKEYIHFRLDFISRIVCDWDTDITSRDFVKEQIEKMLRR